LINSNYLETAYTDEIIKLELSDKPNEILVTNEVPILLRYKI